VKIKSQALLNPSCIVVWCMAAFPSLANDRRWAAAPHIAPESHAPGAQGLKVHRSYPGSAAHNRTLIKHSNTKLMLKPDERHYYRRLKFKRFL
jgi:hypothetical protein